MKAAPFIIFYPVGKLVVSLAEEAGRVLSLLDPAIENIIFPDLQTFRGQRFLRFVVQGNGDPVGVEVDPADQVGGILDLHRAVFLSDRKLVFSARAFSEAPAEKLDGPGMGDFLPVAKPVALPV
jgi:hypothetical protein